MYEFLRYEVQDEMTRSVVNLPADGLLRDAAALFEQHEFNSLPILDSAGGIVGIVTKLDLLRAFDFDDEHMFPPYEEIMQQPVASFVTRDVRAVSPRTPLSKVLHLMVEHRCKSLPVLQQDELVGMIAREDIVRALSKAAQGIGPTPLDDPY
jgi:CBS domain-containing protein